MIRVQAILNKQHQPTTQKILTSERKIAHCANNLCNMDAIKGADVYIKLIAIMLALLTVY
jgi:hypothetical protein